MFVSALAVLGGPAIPSPFCPALMEWRVENGYVSVRPAALAEGVASSASDAVVEIVRVS